MAEYQFDYKDEAGWDNLNIRVKAKNEFRAWARFQEVEQEAQERRKPTPIRLLKMDYKIRRVR